MEVLHHEWTRAEIQDPVDERGAQSSERGFALAQDLQHHQETLPDPLALDCNTNPDTTYRNCAYYLGVSLKMVCNVVKLYCENGLQRTLVLNRNVNSDNATRKIDGAMEARVVAMACGSPPEGYARWTIKLITEHAKVELGLTAGEEAVRRMLKKKRIASSPERLLVIPKKPDADFVACMEDVIEVYERPYAPMHPVI